MHVFESTTRAGRASFVGVLVGQLWARQANGAVLTYRALGDVSPALFAFCSSANQSGASTSTGTGLGVRVPFPSPPLSPAPQQSTFPVLRTAQ